MPEFRRHRSTLEFTVHHDLGRRGVLILRCWSVIEIWAKVQLSIQFCIPLFQYSITSFLLYDIELLPALKHSSLTTTRPIPPPPHFSTRPDCTRNTPPLVNTDTQGLKGGFMRGDVNMRLVETVVSLRKSGRTLFVSCGRGSAKPPCVLPLTMCHQSDYSLKSHCTPSLSQGKWQTLIC